jgi:putative two-component system response regulator
MKTHTTLGRDAIAQCRARAGHGDALPALAKEIAYATRRKWDGSGYPRAWPASDPGVGAPDGGGRRVRRADQPPRLQASSMASGKHFDPDMLDAFIELQPEFIEIARRYADSDHDMEHTRAKIERFTS